MNINPTYVEISFDNIGVRNSQKRLKQLIKDLAVEPLKSYSDDLMHKFHLVEEILARRVALVIIHWLEYKHNPMKPTSSAMMSEITNATKHDVTLKEFYLDQVKDGMYELSPVMGIELPYPYELETEELEYALIELEERFERKGGIPTGDGTDDHEAEADYYDVPEQAFAAYDEYGDYNAAYNPFSDADSDVYDAYDEYDYDEYDDVEEAEPVAQDSFDLDSFLAQDDDDDIGVLQDIENMDGFESLADVASDSRPVRRSGGQSAKEEEPMQQDDKAIVLQQKKQAPIEPAQEKAINIDVLNLSAERAWQLTYSLMGYRSEYIQQQMLPRWQNNPEMFEKDRRFLYNSFVEAIRNAAGAQVVAGNFRFADRPMTVDELWNHYYSDLAQNVGPQLASARLEAQINTPWWQRWWQTAFDQLKRLSPVWMVALVIALAFDGLTTYVSLDQTPMEGFMVLIFTLLITALFQIADLLVISYRQREFEADAMTAKYQAQFNKFTKMLQELDTTSDSYVQLSMKKSQSQADWKAAEDNRKMARRGRFWSARIADINVIVTAYGFAYMFLNSSEPMYALFQQVDIIQRAAWEQLNLWVFLMIGLAITVSFVINTAQRTEILGWSMRRLKNE